MFFAERLKHAELLLPVVLLLFTPVLTYYSISLFSTESSFRVAGFLVALIAEILLVYLLGAGGTFILLAFNAILLIILVIELISKLEK